MGRTTRTSKTQLLLGMAVAVLAAGHAGWLYAWHQEDMKPGGICTDASAGSVDEFVRCLDVLDLETYLNEQLVLEREGFVGLWSSFAYQCDPYCERYVIDHAHLYPCELLERIQYNPYLRRLSRQNPVLMRFARDKWNYSEPERIRDWGEKEWREWCSKSFSEIFPDIDVRKYIMYDPARWRYAVEAYIKDGGFKPATDPVSPSRYNELSPIPADKLLPVID